MYTAYIIKTPIISWIDYPNDEDVAIVWYFTGCGHNCHNCHNKELQTLKAYGSEEFTIEKFFGLTEYYTKRNKTNKVVLEGGDPLFDINLNFTKDILNVNNRFDICVYTGYELDYVKKNNVNKFTFLKTGIYDEQLKQTSEKTNDYISFASKNQKLYDKNYNLLSENGKYFWRNYV